MDTKKFTDRFNEILKSCGFSQNDIAKSCFVSRQTISDFKHGRSFPSIFTLYLICKKCDVSSDYLLGLSDFF